jgi:hypothetical protein
LARCKGVSFFYVPRSAWVHCHSPAAWPASQGFCLFLMSALSVQRYTPTPVVISEIHWDKKTEDVGLWLARAQRTVSPGPIAALLIAIENPIFPVLAGEDISVLVIDRRVHSIHDVVTVLVVVVWSPLRPHPCSFVRVDVVNRCRGEMMRVGWPAACKQFDLKTGEPKCSIPTPGQATLCNDIVVANDGTACLRFFCRPHPTPQARREGIRGLSA